MKIKNICCIGAGHFWAITAIVGPPTYPAPIQQIFLIFISFYFLYFFSIQKTDNRQPFTLNYPNTI